MRWAFWRRRKRYRFAENPSLARVVDGLVQHSRWAHGPEGEPLKSMLMVMAEEKAAVHRRLARSEEELREARASLGEARESLTNELHKNEDLKKALIRLDRQAEIVIETEVSGDHGLLSVVCHDLDETREAIWGRYDAASDALKEAL